MIAVGQKDSHSESMWWVLGKWVLSITYSGTGNGEIAELICEHGTAWHGMAWHYGSFVRGTTYKWCLRQRHGSIFVIALILYLCAVFLTIFLVWNFIIWYRRHFINKKKQSESVKPPPRLVRPFLQIWWISIYISFIMLITDTHPPHPHPPPPTHHPTYVVVWTKWLIFSRRRFQMRFPEK